MAAEWYYSVGGQQTGPVELQTLRDMVSAKSLSEADLVFGPGMTQWTPAGRALGLANAASGATVAGALTGGPSVADPSMLAYRGVETTATGLSPVAMDMFKQTGPWARFVAIIIFIMAGFLIICGIAIAAISGSRAGSVGLPPAVGILYVFVAALYLVPGVLLNRYASGIANLLRTQRMTDVEYALRAQKSFWKFLGIMIIAVIALYMAVIIFIAARGRL